MPSMDRWDEDLFDEGSDDESGMPTRVKKIFSAIDSPQRLRILRTLNSKGPLSYSDLKKFAGFHPKSESGKFAYHLRSLDNPVLVLLDKNTKQYDITSLGKTAINLVKQIEEKSIRESGRMYVRTSHQAIEDFNSDKILQSLVREGHMPLDLAHRITEETKNRINRYRTSHLTGPLIRELVNAVLLEGGHEDYRSKMARLGIPVHDLQQMLTDVDSVMAGLEHIMLAAGQRVFVEYLLTNILPQDVADMYLAGGVHISNLALWPLAPDTVFLNLNDIIRESSVDTPSLVKTFNHILWEASSEVVIDGMADTDSAPQHMRDALIMMHAPQGAAHLSLYTPLKSKYIHDTLESYKAYVSSVDGCAAGLIVDVRGVDIAKYSDTLSDIIKSGGSITVTKQKMGRSGITEQSGARASAKMHSLAINLPRLAYESEGDEAFFRAKLTTRMEPIISALETRRKDIANITRGGLNPTLADNVVKQEKKSVNVIVNLVGMHEAMTHILGDSYPHNIQLKVLKTANSKAAKISSKTGFPIFISMIHGDGAARLVELDAKRYGKDKVYGTPNSGYQHGISIDIRKTLIPGQLGDIISNTEKTAAMLGGGMYTELLYDIDTPLSDIKHGLELLSGRVNFTVKPRHGSS
ncbi:MAG: ArsR family transcriptional regulator [Cenarchaeum sp. SB0661_bin_35]|nr:ArsR family transcriptional regulator [Cenarchaeum sp. SB0667_bin_13]MXZ93136.1 ArsR family transcriptional regulator [Cenarchaeum sp. SB0666_bin_15]MYC79415.1 ArsR family transcriptional regulator [Cenarchaeum sp. SB0661_bin_35]MYD58000.1 ArsR family transcriptional regulator [Cenarchaeum sp. SB0678_bin_8]